MTTILSDFSPLTPSVHCHSTQRQNWGQLHGSSVGLCISQMALQKQQPIVVITEDTRSAQRLTNDIAVFAPNLAAYHFPDWETLPYDIFSPHQDIISERLTALYQFPKMQQGVLVLPLTTLMHKLPPPDYINGRSLLVKKGEHLDANQLRTQFEKVGYRCVSQVIEHGEFAVRGNLFDIFPMGSRQPYRLDLFDDEVENIRYFDPETQRSLESIDEICLLAAREFPLDKEGIERFRTRWRQEFTGDPTRSPIYQDVSTGLSPAGIEYYLPLFFEQTHHLFDYLPDNTLLMSLGNLVNTAETFWEEIQLRYQQLGHDRERPLLPPQQLFFKVDELFAQFKQYSHIHLEQEAIDKGINFATTVPPTLPVDARATEPLADFNTFQQNFTGRILITTESMGRRETVLNLLKKYKCHPTIAQDWQDFLQHDAAFMLTIAPLEQGLLIKNPAIAVISETELFGERVAQRRLRKHKKAQRDTDTIIRDLTELSLEDPVVHEEYGVGRYKGLLSLDRGEIEAEFLCLEYAKQEKLYVPVGHLHLINRFTGADPEHAPLHRLGSGQWEKARRKASQQITDVATELLDIYAQRAARKGHIFQRDETAYESFAQAFPFEETPDQQEAIAAVLEDMHSSKPMDRLVCGDVGFGKTEVAMRAAFVAVQDGQQVAVLVPTTLLAQQHFQNFQDRFAEWAVKVEQLSRFRSKKQQDQALEECAEGKIDIIIGTHKLLQQQIKFKRLGLVIIDEEHRFGVKQKDQFKSLRAEVDILTLTATPIPRSLNMALSNLRDLSIIATPPSRRLAVKTFVKEWHKPSIIEALTRELKRGGQVYFLHNDIDTIEKMAEEISGLVPEARVEFAHGKMRERELEHVMQDFYHRRFNVLVCTTIIETGIDVPSANTIIINRADKLGLAQLYQLRGRVGRSHHRAYAYLIVPPKKSMTRDAVKRLDAISAIEELGMGFTLATHDLEIRGAGEILGSGQSGHMQEIGYTLYTELLERAVESLKSGEQPEVNQPLKQGIEIDFYTSALLPSSYLPDVHIRLIMYKRIANAVDKAALEEIEIEMIDRFGLLPDSAKALLKITELKLQSTPLGIRKIELGTEGGSVLFHDNTTIDPMKVVALIQNEPQRYRLEGAHKLCLLWSSPDFDHSHKMIDELLRKLIS